VRFWITKNSELPVREQLVRQVLLAILSEDIPPGHRLPSVRALARRHSLHPNTVSAAYHDLLEQGWLELRRGSGLYVCPLPVSAADGSLDRMLAALLQAARLQGHEPAEVLQRLEQMVRPQGYQRVLIVEPEPAMREILKAELAAKLPVLVEAAAQADVSGVTRTVVVALPTRMAVLRRTISPKVLCITLRLRSVQHSLEAQKHPGKAVVISVASRSAEIRYGARAMLIAVGLHPDAVCEIDAATDGWQSRIGSSAMVIADVVTAREIPSGCPVKEFRVIADSVVEQLKQLCPAV